MKICKFCDYGFYMIKSIIYLEICQLAFQPGHRFSAHAIITLHSAVINGKHCTCTGELLVAECSRQGDLVVQWRRDCTFTPSWGEILLCVSGADWWFSLFTRIGGFQCGASTVTSARAPFASCRSPLTILCIRDSGMKEIERRNTSVVTRYTTSGRNRKILRAMHAAEEF